MATSQTFPVKGMHCASCASIIERNLKKVDGVEDISVNYGNESMRITYDADKTNPGALSKNMESLGYGLVLPKKHGHMSQGEHAEHLGMNQSKEEKLQELSNMRTNIISVLPLALFSVLIMGWEIFA